MRLRKNRRQRKMKKHRRLSSLAEKFFQALQTLVGAVTYNSTVGEIKTLLLLVEKPTESCFIFYPHAKSVRTAQQKGLLALLGQNRRLLRRTGKAAKVFTYSSFGLRIFSRIRKSWHRQPTALFIIKVGCFEMARIW